MNEQYNSLDQLTPDITIPDKKLTIDSIDHKISFFSNNDRTATNNKLE